MSRFGFMLIIAFYGLGFIWCREMFPRWQEDMLTLKSSDKDAAEKFVTLLLWGLTAVLIFAMISVTVFLAVQLKNSL